MLDFLSGDIENQKAPLPYISQKDKDWLSEYIKTLPKQVVDGKISKPSDYYGFENMVVLGNYNSNVDCENEEEKKEECNIPIELLDGDKYTERCRTYIEGLQPSFTKPIAKEVGNTFAFNPSDLGSVALEYIAYPVYGKIVSKLDVEYNVQVIDEDKSINYQYSEWARELLIYFITQSFGIGTRENAIQQQLQSTGKLVRG